MKDSVLCIGTGLEFFQWLFAFFRLNVQDMLCRKTKEKVMRWTTMKKSAVQDRPECKHGEKKRLLRRTIKKCSEETVTQDFERQKMRRAKKNRKLCTKPKD